MADGFDDGFESGEGRVEVLVGFGEGEDAVNFGEDDLVGDGVVAEELEEELVGGFEAVEGVD